MIDSSKEKKTNKDIYSERDLPITNQNIKMPEVKIPKKSEDE